MPEYTPKLNIPKLLDNDTFSTETFGAIVVAIDENAADQLTVDNHISDNTSHVPFFVATGIANVYSVGLPKGFTLKRGIGISVEINVNNTGASTLNIANTGAKSIKKQNGNDVAAGQLKAGSIYTLRYNGTNFILQGEGGNGNAVANDLLMNKTASTDTGDIVGAMSNFSGFGVGADWTNVEGDIWVEVPIPQSGFYNTNSFLQIKDTKLIPQNIKKDVNILGVVGTLDVATLGGRKFASGTIAHGGNATHLQASGGALDFLPKYIMVWEAYNKLLVYNADQSTTTYYTRFNNVDFTIDGVNNYVRTGEFRLSKGYTVGISETYNWIAIG
jgi:hypothetical protein